MRMAWTGPVAPSLREARQRNEWRQRLDRLLCKGGGLRCCATGTNCTKCTKCTKCAKCGCAGDHGVEGGMGCGKIRHAWVFPGCRFPWCCCRRGAGAACSAHPGGGHRQREVEQHLGKALAEGIRAQAGRTTAPQRLVQHEIQRVQAGNLVALHLAFEQMREPAAPRARAELCAQERQVAGFARNDADVLVVALVTAARPGQRDQRHADHRAARGSPWLGRRQRAGPRGFAPRPRGTQGPRPPPPGGGRWRGSCRPCMLTVSGTSRLGARKEKTFTTCCTSARPNSAERVPAAIEVPADAHSRCRNWKAWAAGGRAARRSSTSRVASTRALGPYRASQPMGSTLVAA